MVVDNDLVELADALIRSHGANAERVAEENARLRAWLRDEVGRQRWGKVGILTAKMLRPKGGAR